MQKFIQVVGKINYWMLILLPFSVAIAPGPANTVIGIMIGTFLVEKLLKREKPTGVAWPLLLFGIFMLAGLLSFINSVDWHASFKGLTKLLKSLMIFLVYSQQVKDRRHFIKIAVACAGAITLTGLDAFWQLFSGKDFIRGNALQGAIGLPRATAAFPGCNALGIYLTALTPLVAGLVLFYNSLKARVFFSVAALIGSAGIYLSLSRGAGLGLFVSLLFLSLIKKNKIIIGGLLLVLAVYPLVMPGNIKAWVKTRNNNPLLVLIDPARITIFENTINMISQHPVIGVGINTFSKNYGKYKTQHAEARFKTSDTYYAHNNFLHLAGEMGLLGVLAFFAFLFFVFKAAWLAFKRHTDPFLKALSVAVCAGILAYLVNGFTETSLYHSRLVMIFWFLIGLGLALARGLKAKNADILKEK